MLGLRRLGKFISPLVTLVMLVSAIAGIARAQPKEQEKKPSKLEFGIRPSVTLSSHGKGYYDWLNDKLRKGDYTWKIPMLWRNIPPPNSTGFGIEGSCLVRLKPSKINPRVGIVAGYSTSSTSSEYNQKYENVYDPFTKKFGDFKFNREEDTHTGTISFGPKVKASLTDKIDVSATLTADLIKAKSEVNYTRKTMFPWYSKEHIEWRKADCSGSGTGYSFKVGLDYEIWKNFSFGVALGYRSGKVQTKGEEVITTSTWPKGYSKKVKYNPKIDFNSTCIEGGVELKF